MKVGWSELCEFFLPLLENAGLFNINLILYAHALVFDFMRSILLELNGLSELQDPIAINFNSILVS